MQLQNSFVNGYSKAVITIGDSIVLFNTSDLDTFPKCNDANNKIDSMNGLEWKYIHSLTTEQIEIKTIKGYQYDTITQLEKSIKRKEDKCTYNRQWRNSSQVLYSERDSTYIYVYKRAIFSIPVIVDVNDVFSIASYSHYTECDSKIRMLMKDIRFTFAPNSTVLKLYRWNSIENKIKIKGRKSNN